MRFSLDTSWQRYGRVVIAGSPLTTFRLTSAGEAVAAAIEAGQDVPTSWSSRLIERLLDTGAIHPAVSGRSATFTTADVTVVTPRLGGTAAGDGRITVDDGSRPPVDGATLRLECNRGPAAARNAGRALVSTPLIAFVDADVDTFDQLGAGSWMLPLLGHFDDPLVGLVAPRVCGEPGSPLDLGARPARVRAGTRVSYVPAAAVVVRAAAFDAVGGFDEALRLGEDVDLVWRLDQAGWRCRYEPSAVVWHHPRATRAGRLRQHAAYGSSAAPLALRHPRMVTPLRVNGWTASCWALAVAGRPVAALGLAFGSALALIPKLTAVPPPVPLRIAISGHLRAAEQIASAVRREWWPIVALGAIASRRIRLVGLSAIAARPSALPTDLAYGWGVWRGMLRTRSVAPIVPQLVSWPARRRTGRRGHPDH